MSRRPGFALLAAVVLPVLVGCAAVPPTSDEGPFQARLALVPVLPPSAQGRFAGLVVDAARVQVRRGGGGVVDTTVAFPAGASSIALALRVPLEAPRERLAVELSLSGGPTVLFQGQALVDVSAGRDAPPAQPTIPLTYVGPGANVASLELSPRDPIVLPGASLVLDVSARDAAGNDVPQFYVTWTSSDPRVEVGVDGQVDLPPDRAVVTIGARTPTGVSTATTIVVSPPAASIQVLSGDGQSGSVGGRPAEDLVAQVRATDGGGVPGVPVRFQASGGAIPADVVIPTALDGTAALSVTFGPAPGLVTVTATAAGLSGSAIFRLTATPGAVARLVPVGGAGQTGEVGVALGAALEVQAMDQFGNPVAGAAVDWTAEEGGGAPNPASTLTDGQGIARTQLTTGPLPIVNVATATAAGSTVSYPFAALTRPGSEAAIVPLTGGGETDGAPLASFQAQVRDAMGNPVSGAAVTWQIVSGFGRFQAVGSVSGPGGVVGATIFPDPNGGNSVVRVSLVSAPLMVADFPVSQGTPTTRIGVTGGGGQTGVVGQALGQPVRVDLLDSDFVPVAGVTLDWSVAAGAGTFAPTPAVTDLAGRISEIYTAGPVAGRQVGRVVEPVSGVAAIASWDVGPGPAARLWAFSGDGQTGVVGTPLALPLQVLVVDGFGNPVVGARVDWSAGSGSVDSTSTTTDARGLAQVRFTPGTSGPVDVQATEASSGQVAAFRIVAP